VLGMISRSSLIQIVPVGSIRMNAGANRVPSSMNEVFSVTFGGDEAADGPVHFPPRDLSSRRDGGTYGCDAEIASVFHYCEDFSLPFGRLTDTPGPGDVIKHSRQRILLRPNIEKDEIPVTNGGTGVRGRCVMRNAAALIYRDDRFVPGGREPLSQKRVHDPLLDIVFRRSAITYAPTYFAKRLGCYQIDLVACPKVCVDLFIAQRSLELGDEIPGAGNPMPETADHLDRSSVHHADVEDQLVGEYCIAMRRKGVSIALS
jgi:hypothetical protein